MKLNKDWLVIYLSDDEGNSHQYFSRQAVKDAVAAEREQCAKIIDILATEAMKAGNIRNHLFLLDVAQAIRAHGGKK